jgi:hypothetical protein
MGEKNLKETAEIVIHAEDIRERDGRSFQRLVDAALTIRPRNLLVHLIAGSQLRLASITTLLQARRKARGQGTRFLLRPSNRAVLGHLRSMGLGKMLAQGETDDHLPMAA